MKKYSLEREDLEKETEVEFFRGSGPGGQRRNKRETGVRIRHVPSGLAVEAQERASQQQNRELAFERLAELLEELNMPVKPRIPTKPSRASQEERLQEKEKLSQKKLQRRSPRMNS